MSINPERRANHSQIIDELELLMDTYHLDYDSLLIILARQMADFAEKEEHETIKDCLIATAENLSQASFNYYASTK